LRLRCVECQHFDVTDFPVLIDHYMNKQPNIDSLISRTDKLATKVLGR